jgi:hypothetical protein
LDEAISELDGSRGASEQSRDFLNLCLVYGEIAQCRSAIDEHDLAIAAAAEECRIAHAERIRMHPVLVAFLL